GSAFEFDPNARRRLEVQARPLGSIDENPQETRRCPPAARGFLRGVLTRCRDLVLCQLGRMASSSRRAVLVLFTAGQREERYFEPAVRRIEVQSGRYLSEAIGMKNCVHSV